MTDRHPPFSQDSRAEARKDDMNPAEEQEQEQESAEEKAELADKLAQSLNAIDRQYAAQRNVEKRIFIVGTGSIGKLVAHSLRGIPNPPPITLLLHRHDLLQAWEMSDKVITVKDNQYVVPRTGFDVELAIPGRRQHGIGLREGAQDIYSMSDETGLRPHEVAKMVSQQQRHADAGEQEQTGKSDDLQELDTPSTDSATTSEPITNLILTTKTIRTISALSTIKHRLSRDSTICFLQNGMGIIDDVNKHVFPDESTRPNYVQGIVSHGANVPPDKAADDPFYVVHAGHGTIALGIIPRESNDTNLSDRPPTPTGSTDKTVEGTEYRTPFPSSARYMIRTLTRTPVLAAVGYTPIELLQLQLEKLAVNSIMNPLTSLLDNRNGALLYNFALMRTMRLMLAETSLVIRSLPELRGIPNVPRRFSAERLETLVVGVSEKTKNNISSMLADMLAGRKTEIEYINGYIVRRGEELGIKCVVNYAIMQVVIGKVAMMQREFNEDVPMQRSREGMNRE